MTMPSPASMINRLGERMNPIVVKELRQAVRSKYIVAIMLLFLTVSLLVTGFPLLTGESDLSYGRNVFSVLSGVLLFASMFFIPGYAAVRILFERSGHNLDLFYTTTITPGRIISGKFWASMTVALLIFSTCLPFMFFSYILRGIDLGTILFILGAYLLITALAIQGALFFACLPSSKVFRIFLALGMLIGYFIFYSTSLSGLSAFVHYGSGNPFTADWFWSALAITALVFVSLSGFFHFGAVSLITARHANRTLALRLHATGCWLVSGMSCGIMAMIFTAIEPFRMWQYLSLLGLLGFLLLCMSEADTYSVRVRRNLSSSRLVRAGTFLFYSAAAGGVLWAVALAALTVLCTSLPFPQTWTASWTDTKSVYIFGTFFLYAYCYTQTAILLRRWFWAHKPKAAATWTLALVLMALINGLPPIVHTMLARYLEVPDFHRTLWQLGNPFILMVDQTFLDKHMLLAVGWAILATLLNFPWFVSQIRNYRPLENPPPSEPETKLDSGAGVPESIGIEKFEVLP